ncbi:MAG: TonB-dependent receptor [Planctomycetes bacterium]|nr:TonB-dependent receptor [Planctomycetota bacterium]
MTVSRPPVRGRRARPAPFLLAAVLASSGAAFAPPASADDAADEVRRLRADLDAERSARGALEARLAALERAQSAPAADEIRAQIDAYMTEKSLFETAPAASLGAASSASFLDVSVMLAAQFGSSTATDEALGGIMLGDHDPHVRGANVRNEELVVSADVDPYFTGFLDVVWKIDEEGESQFELEEAYGQTTSLPCGLQWKLGQFFTEFGRSNPTHPHAWEFMNTPVVLGRVFGPDGYRGQGMRLSWAVPTCGSCPITLLAGWQNARGETQASFLGEEGEEMGDHVLVERDVARLSDLSWHARAEMSCDRPGPCAGTLSWLAGLSAAYGPNATGPDGSTSVYGADFFLKWRPGSTDGGWPWVAWQTEVVWRDYRADDQVQTVDDGAGGTTDVLVPSKTYEDWGFYSQLVWGFCRPWTVGLRLDWADSDGIYPGSHTRVSGALTYYPSEFSRLRLQVQWDDVDGLSDEYAHTDDGNVSVWLGVDLALGKHGAHKF